jgi:hypothetical protein
MKENFYEERGGGVRLTVLNIMALHFPDVYSYVCTYKEMKFE